MTWKALTLSLALTLFACGGGDDAPPAGGDPDAADVVDSSVPDDDAAATPDGGADGDATTPDGGPGSRPGGTCGRATCTGDQICCVTSGRGGSQTCQTQAECDTAGGTGFACDSPADCTEAGTTCCIGGDGSVCAPTGECRGAALC